jgi:pimeloyl-ACP methyl ester carboxylesterase
MIPDTSAQAMPRGIQLLRAAGLRLAAGGASFYFTHPQRVVAELPPDLAVISQDVYRVAADGARLHAIWLPGRNSHDGRPHDRTIVHSHGFNSSGGVVLARSAFYQRGVLRLASTEDAAPLLAWPLVRSAHDRGYNFLLVDTRAHGRSAGRWDPTGVKAMSDLMGWVTWLRQAHDQLWVGLWGNSFGASIGLGLATRPVGGGFEAMVLDSPAVLSDGLYAGVLHEPLYEAIQPVLRQFANPELIRKIESEHVWMPLLLIHGAADTHVPAWHSQLVYRFVHNPDEPERSDLWLVPGAGHLEALEVAPEEYVSRTLNWFDKWFA